MSKTVDLFTCQFDTSMAKWNVIWASISHF